MTNPLIDIIPAAARRYVYALYALGALILSSLALAEVPTLGGLEIVKCVGIWGLIGAAVGATAASNTTAPTTAPEADEAGAADVGLALLIVAVLGIALLLFGVRFDR